MTEPLQDEAFDDALLPEEDELDGLADDMGWSPEAETPIEADD